MRACNSSLPRGVVGAELSSAAAPACGSLGRAHANPEAKKNSTAAVTANKGVKRAVNRNIDRNVDRAGGNHSRHDGPPPWSGAGSTCSRRITVQMHRAIKPLSLLARRFRFRAVRIGFAAPKDTKNAVQQPVFVFRFRRLVGIAGRWLVARGSRCRAGTAGLAITCRPAVHRRPRCRCGWLLLAAAEQTRQPGTVRALRQPSAMQLAIFGRLGARDEHFRALHRAGGHGQLHALRVDLALR